MRRAASWVLAVLAAGALTLSLLALFANRNVFSADGFADRTEQTLRSDAVSAELARRLTDAAIRAHPDVIALRPLVTSAAEAVVRSAAFRSLVRAGARDVHRSVFDRDASTVTLTIADVGVLLNEAIRHLRPDLARPAPERPGRDALGRGDPGDRRCAGRGRARADARPGLARWPGSCWRWAPCSRERRRAPAWCGSARRWRWWRGWPRWWRPSRLRC